MKRFFLLIGFMLLVGCASPPPAATPTTTVDEIPPELTFRELPVTFTPAPTAAPPTPATPGPPQPTGVPDTPIPFGETVVELRYTIPALSLDRRLQGNLGSQIIFVDETTGLALQRSNQGNVLLQLQQALPTVELAPLPEGCGACVHVSYELPLSEESGSGWLQDPVILASIENLMTNALGAHFPPGAMIGLRRSASPYYPAHAVALTADGRLWTWLATEEQVAEPLALPDVAAALQARLDALLLAELEDQYALNCPGSPRETLFLNPGGESDPEAGQAVQITCPEFVLPAILLPLYTELNDLLAVKLAGVEGPARPTAAFPLTALLDYKRADGARLTLYQNGDAIAAGAAGAVYTSTLPATQVISLTTNLLATGLLQPGLTSLRAEATAAPTGTVTAAGTVTATTPASRLLVRGPNGVYDAKWTETIDPALASVDDLLESLLAQAPGTPETAETAEASTTASPSATAESEATATPSPAATATATRPPTPTP